MAEVRAAAHHVRAASAGPCGSLARAVPVVAGVVPVGAPLPHVAGHVVQSERRSAGTRRPARCPRKPSAPVFSSGNVPWKTFMRCSPPGSRSSPHGNAPPAVRRGRRTPTPLRSAGACRSTRSTPRRRPTTRARPDGRRARRRRTADLRDAASRRRYTWRHHSRADDASRVGEVVGQQAGEHERPAVALGLGDVAGRRRRTPRTRRWSRCTCRSRSGKGRLVHRAFAVTGVGPQRLIPHLERSAAQLHKRRRMSTSGTYRGRSATRLARSARSTRPSGTHPSRWTTCSP